MGATDPDGDSLNYTATGPDADKFDVNVNTGELTFKNAPDYEASASAAENNSYAVTVMASDGEAKSYARTSDAGRTIELHFCPNCGVSVYFRAEARPNMIGIHAGCFADPAFPAPNVAIWTESRHHWLTLPEVDLSLEQQTPP